jgi:hypothetical protein
LLRWTVIEPATNTAAIVNWRSTRFPTGSTYGTVLFKPNLISHKGDAVRKFVSAIVFSIVMLIITGAGTGPVQAQQGVVTFKFTNNAPFIIYARMFSQSRSGFVWPATGHFVLNDGVERSARLSCLVGERICFGAAYSTDGTGKYWGAGYKGVEACTGCCLRCGTTDADVSATWNLIE